MDIAGQNWVECVLVNFGCDIWFLLGFLLAFEFMFRKRVSSHIWQTSNIYGNPATFNKRKRNRERPHPNTLIK